MILPSVVVAFRLNPSWASLEFSGADLSPEVKDEVDEVIFEKHTATLYANVSKDITQSITLHAGIFLTDVRTRSGSAILTGGLSSGPIPDMNADQIGGFIGFMRQVNPRAFVMGEAGSIPRYKYTLHRVTGLKSPRWRSSSLDSTSILPRESRPMPA